MSSIKARNGHCRECRWYRESEAVMKATAGRADGICQHPTRNGKRKTPYNAAGFAHCCFDAEDPDGQMTIEDIEQMEVET